MYVVTRIEWLKKALKLLQAAGIGFRLCIHRDTRNISQKKKNQAVEKLVKFPFLSWECGPLHGLNFF